MIESHSYADFAEMSHHAADLVAQSLVEALSRGRAATLTLAGGSTPREAYAHLADARDLPWERVHIFWGDERYLPPDAPESNARMAHEALLSKIPVPPENIHEVRTGLPGPEAAADYERQIRAACGRWGETDPGTSEWQREEPPALDVVLLGMGPDGHTASLFPGSAALAATGLVAFAPAPRLTPQVPRITMTLPLLNSARLVIFLVSGSEKLPIVREILEGAPGADRYPAARVRPRGRLVWLVHQPA